MNAQARAFFARLGEVFNRKTIRGFVECIPSLRELDPVFQDAFLACLEPADPLLSFLHFPSQSILTRREAYPWLPAAFLPWEITPQRVLILTRRCLWDAALPYQSSGPPALRSYPLDSLLWLEIGYELLEAWFAWEAPGQEEAVPARIHFNTVGRPLVEAFSAQLRACLPLQAPPGDVLARPDLLAGLPYAFQSVVPRLLLAGDALQSAVFCPGGPGKQAQSCPATLFLRTTRELVAARQQVGTDGRICGLRCHFIPLAHLRGFAFQAEALVLSFAHGAEREVKLSLPCTGASQPALRALLTPL